MAKKDKNDKETASDGVIAGNKTAYHDYQILSSMEAGIALHGTEVKSCRMHSVSLHYGRECNPLRWRALKYQDNHTRRFNYCRGSLGEH